jgi:predicted ATP-binding protein involved in virulence
MTTKPKKPAMYFSSLEIENIKCFSGRQTLDLKDSNGNISPWTLILGDNGIGKTTLLKCLAWMTPVQAPKKEAEKLMVAARKLIQAGVSMAQVTDATGLTKEAIELTPDEDDDLKVKIKPLMDDFEENAEYEKLLRLGADVKSEIKAVFSNGVELRKSPTEDALVTIGMTFEKVAGEVETIDPIIGNLTEFNSPNLFAYGASRHMALKNFDKFELKNPIFNLFSDSSDLYDAEQLLSILDTASIRKNRKGKATKLLKKVKQILSDLLPDIKSPDDIIIHSPLNDDGSANHVLVEIITPYGKVALSNLSLGYQTMLAWMVDLALRMLWRNPDSTNPLHEPAVVIVDEVDLHLHPKWQRQLRQDLTYHFKNTQFICTAHSPFMAQDSEIENLCVINQTDGNVRIENEPAIVKGWRIGQIATSDLFGVSSERSIETESDINKRREILDKEVRTEKDERELKKLNKKLEELPVKITDSKEDLRLFEKLEKMSELFKSKK